MLVTRFGHAALLVETADARVLVDPGMFSPDDAFGLEDLDSIIVTHQHHDHLDPQRIDRLLDRNRDAVLLCDPQTAEQMGRPWRPHREGEVTQIGSLTIDAVGAEHAEITPAIPRVANVGVLISEANGQTLFHPGDSYATTPPGVDILALPLSAPWAKVAETIAFVQAVRPRTIFPVHDCTIAERAYDVYWNHVVNFAGTDDVRRLGQREATRV